MRSNLHIPAALRREIRWISAGGICTGFDSFTVVVNTEGRQQLIYKHAISTIVPLKAIPLNEE